MMEKICVFCGKRPLSKNMEHVLPRWLIEETGDPKRIVPLGIEWRTQRLRKFSFNQLMFPACVKCNSDFSVLENEARGIMNDILNKMPLSAKSFDIFLTWLDKVRIGIWLGWRFLDRDFFKITPKFHINQRIRNKDRMVLIYQTTDVKKGLSCILVNSPFFAFSPSCFGLVVNQFYFVNISSDFLLSRRLGLPFPAVKKMSNLDPNFMDVEMRDGMMRMLLPLIRVSYNKFCSRFTNQLFQLIQNTS